MPVILVLRRAGSKRISGVCWFRERPCLKEIWRRAKEEESWRFPLLSACACTGVCTCSHVDTEETDSWVLRAHACICTHRSVYLLTHRHWRTRLLSLESTCLYNIENSCLFLLMNCGICMWLRIRNRKDYSFPSGGLHSAFSHPFVSLLFMWVNGYLYRLLFL